LIKFCGKSIHDIIVGDFMTLGLRLLFYGLIGLLAGALCWPFTELVLFYQPHFPSLLLFSLMLGLVAGLFIGGIFGMSEGIIAHNGDRLRKGAITGMIGGAIGGILGMISGQAALLYIGTLFFNSSGSLKHFGIPISRALGWAVFGLFVGISEGIRSRSGGKVRNGLLGGFIGGLLGGLVVEYARIIAPQSAYSRLVGLSVLGLLVGVSYGFVERGLAEGFLRLLNGRSRGSEFLLTQRKTLVGEAQRTEVTLSGYKNVSDEHAEILREGKNFTVVQGENKKPLYVNDEKVERTVLHNGDIIRVGDAQFRFSRK
jgi:hypothetical protein